MRHVLETARATVKRRLPPRVVRVVRSWRRLSDPERRVYIRRVVQRLWRGRGFGTGPDVTGVRRVVFVCHGNIIRSPMAEVLLRRRLREGPCAHIDVSSAGVYAHPDRVADARARAAAAEFGVSLDAHRARRLTPAHVTGAAAIIVMDYELEAQVLTRFPDAEPRLALLAAFAPPSTRRETEIQDPYLDDLDAVRRSYRAIDAHVARLAVALETSVVPRPAVEVR